MNDFGYSKKLRNNDNNKSRSIVHHKQHKSNSSYSGREDYLKTVLSSIGNQGILRLLNGGVIQAKININKPGDKYEQEADRVADNIVTMSDSHTGEKRDLVDSNKVSNEITNITKTVSNHNSTLSSKTESQITELKGKGSPLSKSDSDYFGQRFGHKFNKVRIHNDNNANNMADSINAIAFTHGNDIVFAGGKYNPNTKEGKKLLAHELVHTIQQGEGNNISKHIQCARLLDYANSNPEHDPSNVSDADIESTNEYIAYMNPSLTWQTTLIPPLTAAEARLACRLILRVLRTGDMINWDSNASKYALNAREQLGTAQEAQSMENDLSWVGSGPSEFSSPSTAQSNFTQWLLAGGPEPNASSGRMNCWEFVLFSAYKAGFVNKSWLETLYRDAATAPGTMGPPETIEARLTSRPGGIYDPDDPDSPSPLPGDIIIFGSAAAHVAISIGGNQVMSLWTPNGGRVETTTIENIIGTNRPEIKFHSAPW